MEDCINCNEARGLSCDYCSADYERDVDEKYLSDLVTLTYTCSKCKCSIMMVVTKKEYVSYV